MNNNEWLEWWNDQVAQERELERQRELNVIKGVVLLSCLIVASIYVFAKYWTLQ